MDLYHLWKEEKNCFEETYRRTTIIKPPFHTSRDSTDSRIGIRRSCYGYWTICAPLALNFKVPAAKLIGKKLLVQEAPESIDIATPKKTPKQASKNTANYNEKQVADSLIKSRSIKKENLVQQKTKRKPGALIRKKRIPVRSRSNFFHQSEKWFLIQYQLKKLTANFIYSKIYWIATFETALTQEIGPSYSLDDSIFEIEFTGDRNIFSDVQRTCLETGARIVQNNGYVLRTHATEAGQKDTPYLVNILLSFFQNAQPPSME